MTLLSAPDRNTHHPDPAVVQLPTPTITPQGTVARLRRSPGGRGRLGRTQLVAAEVVVIGVGLAWYSGSIAAIATAAVAALAVLVVFWGRGTRRWCYEALTDTVALRNRRTAALRATTAGHCPAAADHTTADGRCPAAFGVHDHDDRGGPLGVGRDAHGWFAAVAAGPDDVVSGAPSTIGLDQLTRLLDDPSSRPSTIQLTTLRVAAPAAGLPGNSPCAASYLDLHRSLIGDPPALAAYQTWIVVRLSARDAVEAAAHRGGGPDGVAKTLATSVGRVCKLLAAAGIAHRVLDARALVDAVRASCGLDPTGAGSPAGASNPAGREHRRSWNAGGLAHVSYEVHRWPRRPTSTHLDQLLRAPAAGQLVVSVTLRPTTATGAPGSETLGVATIVRIAAAPDRLKTIAQDVCDHAERLGFKLRALHGRHGPASYASAPTGGRPL